MSAIHHGLRELRTAYLESVMLRKEAFCRNKKEVRAEDGREHIPEGLVQEAGKLTTEAAKLQRVQLIGTDRRDDAARAWGQFFYEVKNGRIETAQYEACMEDFFREAAKTYRNVIEEEALKEIREPFAEDCIDVYEEKLMQFIFALWESINSQLDVNRNGQKIQRAVDYIEQNYAKDLNMAV